MRPVRKGMQGQVPVRERKSLVRIGDKIYVDTALYLGHGRDDFRGGVATVDDVYTQTSGGKPVTFISIQERPGYGYNWDEYLAPKQKDLKKFFGRTEAHQDPDMDPRFNDE